jgi:Arc/MetJ-type ribon-helix-helix transcriptional regulator
MAKVMVSFPTQFLRKVDRAARWQGRSRSELIREALRVTLGERGPGRSWKNAVAPLRELEALWVGDWDSTDIVRYYRDRRYAPKDRR